MKGRGLSRNERVALHKKGERGSVKEGLPTKEDLKEGQLALRLTDEGLVQYVKYKNVLYKNVLEKG